MSDLDLTTADTLGERTDRSRYTIRLLLEENRWVVAGLFAAVIFTTFMVWGIAKPQTLQSQMQSSDMVETVFAGLAGAIITSTTLVVSINQLVLSQEIGSLGSLRNRMDVTMDFRQNSDDLLGRVTPADPAAYLEALIETTVRRAVALDEAFPEDDGNGSERGGDDDGADRPGVRDADAVDDDLRANVERYVEDLVDNAEHARERLVDRDFGTYEVVSPAIDFNYDRKLWDLRRIQFAYDEELTDDQRRRVRALLESLAMYGPVREHVKDLYIQWALVKLSRAILYAAVAALTVAGGMVIFVDASTFTGTFLGVETMLWVVSAAFTLSAFPFLIFLSYVLRLATLAKQTLTIGPLSLT